MKRCPTCSKTFTDQSLSYCIDDGTPLVALPEDDELTDFGRGSEDSRWNPPAYQPPSYVAPSGGKRRTWPWVVGIVGVLLLFLVAFTVAAVVLIPRMIKKANPVVVSNSNSNANNAVNNNANSAAERVPETTNSNSETSSAAPTDKEVVLAQLRDLENEWTVANINADKKQLDKILADDYAGTTADGKALGKAEYLQTIERDTTTQKWDFQDLQLSLKGNRAVLSGVVHFETSAGETSFNFTDRFVWRDGRWQATGSDISPIK